MNMVELLALIEQQQVELTALRNTCADQLLDGVAGREQMARFAHDLRNPLTAVLACTSVLGRVGSLAPTLKDGLAAIDRNARRQAAMIDAIVYEPGTVIGSDDDSAFRAAASASSRKTAATEILLREATKLALKAEAA